MLIPDRQAGVAPDGYPGLCRCMCLRCSDCSVLSLGPCHRKRPEASTSGRHGHLCDGASSSIRTVPSASDSHRVNRRGRLCVQVCARACASTTALTAGRELHVRIPSHALTLPRRRHYAASIAPNAGSAPGAPLGGGGYPPRHHQPSCRRRRSRSNTGSRLSRPGGAFS